MKCARVVQSNVVKVTRPAEDVATDQANPKVVRGLAFLERHGEEQTGKTKERKAKLSARVQAARTSEPKRRLRYCRTRDRRRATRVNAERILFCFVFYPAAFVASNFAARGTPSEEHKTRPRSRECRFPRTQSLLYLGSQAIDSRRKELTPSY